MWQFKMQMDRKEFRLNDMIPSFKKVTINPIERRVKNLGKLKKSKRFKKRRNKNKIASKSRKNNR